MTHSTLTQQNETLTKITTSISTVKVMRNDTINSIVTDAIQYGKANKNSELNISKKNAIASFLATMDVKTKETDSYTKRALKIAHEILVKDKQIQFQLLTISQIEQLLCFSKSEIHKLYMIHDDILYILLYYYLQ